MTYLDVRYLDDKARVWGTAKLQALDLDPRHDYPTQALQSSDLWLVQDDLDAYLCNRTGRIAWLDCLEKPEPGVGPSLSQAFSFSWPCLFEHLGRPAETLMFPYPLGVYDEAQAQLLQARLRDHYALHLGAQRIDGTPLMRMGPVRRL